MDSIAEKSMTMEKYKDGKITQIQRDRMIKRIDDELNGDEGDEHDTI